MSQAKTIHRTEGFSTEQWIVWLTAFVTLVGTVVVFMYATFETKTASDDSKQSQMRMDDSIIKRLDRMEDKIDQLLTNSRK